MAFREKLRQSNLNLSISFSKNNNNSADIYEIDVEVDDQEKQQNIITLRCSRFGNTLTFVVFD